MYQGQSGKLRTSSEERGLTWRLVFMEQVTSAAARSLFPNCFLLKMSFKVSLSVQTAGPHPRKSLSPLHCINNEWVGSGDSSASHSASTLEDWLATLHFFFLTLPQRLILSRSYHSQLIFCSPLSLSSVFSRSLVGSMILEINQNPSYHRNSNQHQESCRYWPQKVPWMWLTGLGLCVFPPSLGARHCFSSTTSNYAQGKLQSEKRRHFNNHHFP